jgi:hypothetical protein
MKTFCEFVDRKEREGKRHLRIVKKLLESHGMKVTSHLDADDPYIFLWNPDKKISFDGVRIYKIGTQMAFRVQKEEKTHPFGRAYPLDIEEMFNDLMSDHHDPDKAGKEVVRAVIEEVNAFFKGSKDAEKDLRDKDFVKDDPWSQIVMKSTGTDYSNTVTGKDG